jgi:hypothetical protein
MDTSLLNIARHLPDGGQTRPGRRRSSGSILPLTSAAVSSRHEDLFGAHINVAAERFIATIAGEQQVDAVVAPPGAEIRQRAEEFQTAGRSRPR